MSQRYQANANSAKHPLLKKLWQIMADKQTNLAVSADVTNKADLLKLADAVGPHICVLKTHIDIVEDFDQDLLVQLKNLAKQHQFLIFEDRKFADIGNTVYLQYAKGIYRIADWADIINAHILPGPGIIEGLKKAGLNQGRGLLLLAQMSSKQNYFTADYTQAALTLAKGHSDFVMGFIAQEKLIDSPDFITMTPGISIEQSSDGLGQGYVTPDQAIAENDSDIIIVGRSIYASANPAAAAELYRYHGWQAHLRSNQ